MNQILMNQILMNQPLVLCIHSSRSAGHSACKMAFRRSACKHWLLHCRTTKTPWTARRLAASLMWQVWPVPVHISLEHQHQCSLVRPDLSPLLMRPHSDAGPTAQITSAIDMSATSTVTVAGTSALRADIVARSPVLVDLVRLRGACLLPVSAASLSLWANFHATRDTLEWQAALQLWEVLAPEHLCCCVAALGHSSGAWALLFAVMPYQ
jgi:hypothetical protein